jgi:hypothetical protein
MAVRSFRQILDCVSKQGNIMHHVDGYGGGGCAGELWIERAEPFTRVRVTIEPRFASVVCRSLGDPLLGTRRLALRPLALRC